MACSGGPILKTNRWDIFINKKTNNQLPINIIPLRWSNSGNLGFSDACPHPAQTAKIQFISDFI